MVQLATVTILHERRVRLSFTADLAAGAFASTSFYAVANLDGFGASPAVAAVYAVANSPHAIDVHLSLDLAEGGQYAFSADAVPASDGSFTAVPSAVVGAFGQPTEVAETKAATDLGRLLYGTDVLFEHGEFVEGPDGDLATVSGPECVKMNLIVSLGGGLPWDPSWGVHAREYVDGPESDLGVLRGRAEAQARRDDRIASVQAEVVEAQSGSSKGTVKVSARLIGADPISAEVSA